MENSQGIDYLGQEIRINRLTIKYFNYADIYSIDTAVDRSNLDDMA